VLSRHFMTNSENEMQLLYKGVTSDRLTVEVFKLSAADITSVI